mgnify:FL=1
MALITALTGAIPDLQHEYHIVTIDTIGQSSANVFTCYLQQPLKNVVQARLLAARINTTVATEHCYVSIKELDTIFSDRASDLPNGQASESVVRNSFASIVSGGTGIIGFKDEYPIVTQYIDPVRTIDRFTVTLRNQSGVPILPGASSNNFLVIRFVCRKANL